VTRLRTPVRTFLLTSFARDASGPEQKVYAVADTPAQNVYAGQQKAHGKYGIAG
jgi:hypothetical protein